MSFHGRAFLYPKERLPSSGWNGQKIWGGLEVGLGLIGVVMPVNFPGVGPIGTVGVPIFHTGHIGAL